VKIIEVLDMLKQRIVPSGCAIQNSFSICSMQIVDVEHLKLCAQLKWKWNKTVSKQFWNCFVSVSFQLCGQFKGRSVITCHYITCSRAV